MPTQIPGIRRPRVYGATRSYGTASANFKPIVVVILLGQTSISFLPYHLEYLFVSLRKLRGISPSAGHPDEITRNRIREFGRTAG